MEKKERFLGSLLGLAVGDCVGVSAEFSPPGTFPLIEDMMGGGPFDLNVGEWTDDTSMALCLAESLTKCQGFNLEDQIQRYIQWFRNGHLSSRDECFDIGIATREALDIYMETGNAYSGSTDPYKAGNGSIMRLSPVPLLWSYDLKQAVFYSGESSKTTHGAEECIHACNYLGALIVGAIQGKKKEELLSKEFVDRVEEVMGQSLCKRIREVAGGSYKHRKPPEIKGTGYVVHSLEAALWAFYHSNQFDEGLLLAVNLGDDSDTTGAVYGQLAGAFYGETAISKKWRNKIIKRDLIEGLAGRLYELESKMHT